MIERKYCGAAYNLLYVQTLSLLISFHHFIKMVRLYCPGSERHDFIQFCELCQSWVHFLQTFSYPFQFTTIENELLLEDVEQVVAFVATYRHDT